MDRKLAIIGSGEMAVLIVENAKQMGVITHSFSNNPRDRVVGFSDYHHNVDIFDVDRIVAICKENGISGVISTTELTIHIAATVAERMGFPGMPTDVSKAVTDKAYVRQKAQAVTSLRQPGFSVIERGVPFQQPATYPVIVKPTALGGKRGISVAYDREELETAIAYACDSMPQHKNRIIIESFLAEGQEYSVESLSYRGTHQVIQITQKITSGPPHCVELGHMQPAQLREDLRKKVETAVTDLLAAVGLDNTTSHTEIKIIDGEIYLIELNARSGGDHIAYPLTELSTGYPYIQGAIKIALGSFEQPNLENYHGKSCGVLFVVQQTACLKPLFDVCEQYDWLYRKNKTTEDVQEIIHNEAFDTNYIMYLCENGIPEEIKEALQL